MRIMKRISESLLLIPVICVLYFLVQLKVSAAISNVQLNNCVITLSSASYTYSGTAKCPQVTVRYNNKLVNPANYTVKYSNNVNAGKATVAVLGKNGLNIRGVKNFTILRKVVYLPSIQNSYYNGAYQTKSINGQYFSVTGTTCAKNAGKYTVKLTPKLNYMWADKTTTAKSITWEILTKDISGSYSFKISDTSFVYTGSEIKPNVTVNGISTTDYYVSYQNNKNVGTATVEVKGKGNYSGSLFKTFKITPQYIYKLSFSPITDRTYTGKDIKPNPSIQYGSKKLVRNVDYTLKYEYNRDVGKAVITVKGKGNFTGSDRVRFSIVKCNINKVSFTFSNTACKSSVGCLSLATLNGVTLTTGAGINFSIKHESLTNGIRYTFTGKGNFTGSVSFTKTHNFSKTYTVNDTDINTHTKTDFIAQNADCWNTLKCYYRCTHCNSLSKDKSKTFTPKNAKGQTAHKVHFIYYHNGKYDCDCGAALKNNYKTLTALTGSQDNRSDIYITFLKLTVNVSTNVLTSFATNVGLDYVEAASKGELKQNSYLWKQGKNIIDGVRSITVKQIENDLIANGHILGSKVVSPGFVIVDLVVDGIHIGKCLMKSSDYTVCWGWYTSNYLLINNETLTYYTSQGILPQYLKNKRSLS